jgi:hypothetical protein
MMMRSSMSVINAVNGPVPTVGIRVPICVLVVAERYR